MTVTVHNLSTDETLEFTCNAEAAVCAAYAISVHRAGDVSRAVDLFGHMVIRGKRSVACGDFCAMISPAYYPLADDTLQADSDTE